MHWKRGELRTIELGQWRKRPNVASYTVHFTPYEVPAPYDRLVGQLTAEHIHADSHESHESRRRAVYAMATLDAFGKELLEFQRSKLPTATFRSKVLTPILQRQRLGIHDAYTPFVRACIKNDGTQLTIRDVSKLYLGTDPANPAFIDTYRRNLLYVPDSRWHLGVIMGVTGTSTEEQNSHYHRVRANHDRIMATPLGEAHKERDPRGLPLLSSTEVEVILNERLEDFFVQELEYVVGNAHPSPLAYSHQIPQPERLAAVKANLTLPHST